MPRRFAAFRSHWLSLPRSAKFAAAALVLLLATLFDPHITLPRRSYDFVIVLDITQSMNTEDYVLDDKPVSRLRYVKHVLHQVLRDLPCGSRVGWSIFSEYRVLPLVAPVEVCADYHDLLQTLDKIDGRMAWAGASEIAKGVFWGLRTTKQTPGNHGMVFFTDGQEAPPINPSQRPSYDGKPGEVRGLIVGVGGDTLSPIPKVDPEGNPLGVWLADEVLQTDTISQGRMSTSSRERMVDESGKEVKTIPPTMTEHLSSLKELYLRPLAAELGLGYHRLTTADKLLGAMTSPDLARVAPVRIDLRPYIAGLALALLLLGYLPRFVDKTRTFRRVSSARSEMRFATRRT